MNERFLIFAGSNYYPSGGWNDFQGSEDTLLHALRFAANVACTSSGMCDWWHVVDTTTNEIVEHSKSH